MSPRPVSTVVRLVLALVLATAGSWAGLGITTRAQAATEGSVRIDLTEVTPETLTEKGTVTIRGTVTNTSKRPMRQVQVALWRELAPVRDAGEFERMLDSPWDLPEGERLVSPESAYFNITHAKMPVLAPGAKAEFSVSAKVSDLTLVTPGGGKVYLLGVHVRAIPQGDRNQTVGRSRLFMPMHDANTRARISPVVLLSSAPSLGVDGTFTDDHLAGELTGRLDTLMKAAELPGATVLIDPAMVDELRTMVDGYTVNGSNVDGQDTRALAAQSWLARLETLRATISSRGGAMYRTPFGNPDLATAASLQRGEVVRRTRGAMRDDHPLTDLPLAIWPHHGPMTSALHEFVSSLQPRLLLEPSAKPGVFAPDTATTLLRYDPSIVEGGPGPDPRGSLPQRHGRLLSQLLVQKTPSLLAVRTAAEAATLLELPAWVTTVGTSSMPRTLRAPTPSPPRTPLATAATWDAVDAAHRRVIAWHDLLGTQGGGQLDADQMASRAGNPLLANDSLHLSWIRAANSSVPSSIDQGQFSITIAKSIVMSSPKTSLPVTITNSSNHPVRLQVRLVSDNPQRLTIPDTELVTIAAKSSRSVQFTPEATSNGVVGFSAHLRTASGRPIGQPARFSVNATNFGRVGWMIIIASGVVLLGGTAVRIKQVQRERARSAVTADTPPVPSSHADITSRPHP